MGRIILAASGLVALWLLMSGIFDKPLILIFGVISVALSVWVGLRLDMADGERLTYPISGIRTLRYLCWLLVEIAKSNWAVTKIILSGKSPEKENLFWVPVTQKSDLAQVVFANSITLTPGTISVETEGEHFLVHALDFGEGDMEALADMDARVTAIETNAAGDGT
ncbi:MAG: Na+/H+ antiporter subunit E [Pseudomonadota bacterium]